MTPHYSAQYRVPYGSYFCDTPSSLTPGFERTPLLPTNLLDHRIYFVDYDGKTKGSEVECFPTHRRTRRAHTCQAPRDIEAGISCNPRREHHAFCSARRKPLRIHVLKSLSRSVAQYVCVCRQGRALAFLVGGPERQRI